MTKTQIQIPEELFQEIRTFAKQREWSLAETFRRWEPSCCSKSIPRLRPNQRPHGYPPTSSQVGWKGLNADQLREAAFVDGNPQLI